MQRTLNLIFLLGLLILPQFSFGIEGSSTSAFAGDDLHIRGTSVKTWQKAPGDYVMEFDDEFTLEFGDNEARSNKAVVWLKTQKTEFRGSVNQEYQATIYLSGRVSVYKGKANLAAGVEFAEPTINGAEALVVKFTVPGEVFITAEKRFEEDITGGQLYQQAIAAVGSIIPAPRATPRYEPPKPEKDADDEAGRPKKGKSTGLFGADKKAAAAEQAVVLLPKKPEFRYPVNVSGIAGHKPVIERTEQTSEDGLAVATVTGRFYIWQRQGDEKPPIEFQADSAVLFYRTGKEDSNTPTETEEAGFSAAERIVAVYLRGNIVMTEGQRLIRADEMYYDFDHKQGLAVNATLRNFDQSREIPIYVHAKKLRQISEDKFTGENVVITNSEFYMPQFRTEASKIIITDKTNLALPGKAPGDSLYEAKLYNVKMKLDQNTIFYWPYMRSNLNRSDIPIKRARTGYDSDFGMTVETEWHQARLFGYKEPPGQTSEFLLDYYSEHGAGTGTEVEYKNDDSFGNISAFFIYDKGKDELSRDRESEPPRPERGRVRAQHRQFLEYDWQLTLEMSYLSDENYMESFHREEYNIGKEQETLVHLKRIKDNWGFAMLGKARINDSSDVLEERPSGEFHLAGQSLFDGKMTLYSDSELGSLRQRISNTRSINLPGDHFTFASHRTELDMPLSSGPIKFVPFAAAMFGYDDRAGFDRSILTAQGGQNDESTAAIGEAGVRGSTQFWKTDPTIKSRFWDINGIRHIVKPNFTAVFYKETETAVEQRDKVNLGLSQVWQTKRGPAGKQRIVDWMRLDLDYTWVPNPSELLRADRFMWNKSFVPFRTMAVPGMINSDLSELGFEDYGIGRDSISADYIWRLSDMTTLYSDSVYDVKGANIEQFGVGFSQTRWPNLTYYLSSRYIRSTDIDGEQGSHVLTFGTTYKLSARYTVLYSQQYDTDYGKNMNTCVGLIRRYHRLYYGFTFNYDETLDRTTVMLSIWPEGVKELALGSRRYMGIGNTHVEE